MGIEIIENRVNELGIKEPKIQRQGQSQIVVQIPGYNNPKNIKKILGTTAKMTFHFVKENNFTNKTISLPMHNSHENLNIQKETVLGGEHPQEIQTKIDENFKPYIKFQLNSKGSQIF